VTEPILDSLKFSCMLFYFYFYSEKSKKKLREILKIKNIFFSGQPPFFHKKRVHMVNTSQTMSTRTKNEFQAILDQTCHFR